MRDEHLTRILREMRGEGLLDSLSALTPTDLQSLLLEVYRRRAEKTTPGHVAARYRDDRFSQPSAVDPRDMLELDQCAFEVASQSGFHPIELSPVCPVGTVAAVTNLSQNKIVTTSRNTEVLADSTNVLALECSKRRRSQDVVRLCSSHRVVRAQTFSGAASFAHFRLFGICTAGKARASFEFEIEAMLEHLQVHLRLLNALRRKDFEIGLARIALTDFEGIHADRLSTDVIAPLTEEFPEVDVAFYPERSTGRGYYQGACFMLFITDPGKEEQFITDGGFTPWTQLVLNNRKERLMISGMGAERLCYLCGPRRKT